MEKEQMLEELNELSGFVFNEYLIRGSVIYGDKLLDGKHLEFHFRKAGKNRGAISWVTQSSRNTAVMTIPSKFRKSRIYNFAQLTWSRGRGRRCF